MQSVRAGTVFSAGTPHAPVGIIRGQAVCLGGGALIAVALNAADPLGELPNGKALGAGGGEHLLIGGQLCLDKAGLTDIVKAVDVIVDGLDGDVRHAGGQGQRQLVHAEKAMGAAGGAVKDKGAVDEYPVEAGDGNAQRHRRGGNRYAGVQANGEIFVGFHPCGPHRARKGKGRIRRHGVFLFSCIVIVCNHTDPPRRFWRRCGRYARVKVIINFPRGKVKVKILQ